MKKTVSLLLVFIMLTALCSCGGKEKENSPDKKENTDNILVIYFSDNDCIGDAAAFVAESTGADIVEVKPEIAYPEEPAAKEAQIKKEHSENARPSVKASAKYDPKDYSIIFIGYPLWDGTAPMPLFTYLEKYELKDKAILTFTLSETGRSGESLQDIADIYPYSQIVDKYVFKTDDFEGWQPAFDGWFSKTLYF